MQGGGGGRLLTFSAFRMDSYSRWTLIRGWALIRINTVFSGRDQKLYCNLPMSHPGDKTRLKVR